MWTATTKGYLWGFRPSWWFLTWTNFTKTMTKCYNFASFLQAKRIRRRRRRHINLDSERPPLGRPQRAAWRRTLELLWLPPHSLFSTHLCANTTLWWGRCNRPASEAAIAKTQHNKQTNKRLSLHPPSVTASHFLLLPSFTHNNKVRQLQRPPPNVDSALSLCVLLFSSLSVSSPSSSSSSSSSTSSSFPC